MPAKPYLLDGNSARPFERRAKIVCTIGPACDSEEMMRELMHAGMDVARLNFSHGTHDDHARVIHRLRRAAAEESRTLCILQDLQGPKIRTGRMLGGKRITLKPGSRLTITPRDIEGTPELISTSLPTLAQDVQPGERILLSDGLIELRVLAIHGSDVECEVVNGGLLGEHQGINLPGAVLSVPSMTDKDRVDLEFGLRHGVDAVALSFVRTGEDVIGFKKLIHSLGSDVPVIAKLEKPQAMDHLHQILDVADGVMVARGDLGVEVPPEQVPVMQKRIIHAALEWRKPVITATQMLESMVENPRPTRAEASDVANAIFDGSDAVMLSGETARGKYPREAVEMMARIVTAAESSMPRRPVARQRNSELSIPETICESVAHAADELEMRAIAVFTQTGTTTRLVSKYRPRSIIYGFAHEKVCNRMHLYWGVRPVIIDTPQSAEEMVDSAERELSRRGVIAPGDVLGIVTGRFLTSGFTSVMRLHTVQAEDAGSRPERRRTPRYRPSHIGTDDKAE